MEKLTFKPLTAEDWKAFEELFGAKGACGGCWCMYWRTTRSQFEKQKGEGNKRAMKKIVDMDETPGIIAYSHGSPVGWCSVAPRENFSSLERSRILMPIDAKPVWSVVCLYIAKPYRKKGVSVQLLKAVVDYVRKRGGKIVEGYPVEPKKDEMPDVFAFTGLASAFLKAGFKEQARRSETRPIMRYVIKD